MKNAPNPPKESDPKPHVSDHKFFAIALFLIGGILITCMTAIIRNFAPSLPTGQIIFWRTGVALIPILAYMVYRKQWPQALFTRRPKLHAIRITVGFAAMVCSFTALKTLSIALLTAISFLSPLISLPLAVIFLGERLTARRILATCLGLVGVVFVLYYALTDGVSGTLRGVMLALIFAVLVAVVRILLKELSRTEHAATITIYFALAGTVLGGLSAFGGWASISIDTWAWLACAGLLGGVAHICFTEAVARMEVSHLAPLSYLDLVWAAGLDLAIFHVLPGLWSVVGMVIIVAAGLIVVNERKLNPRRMGHS